MQSSRLFKSLPVDYVETREGVDRAGIHHLRLSDTDQAEMLANAVVITIDLKRVIGGFADIYRFTPCIVAGTRLEEIVDKNPQLNIELGYPMGFEQFRAAFRLALDRAG